jgi:nucleoside-diphosphate-sugar epimerase
MRILFTGASSFTGYWFVKALVAAGHEVIAPLRGSPLGYEGVRKVRIEKLAPVCRLIPEVAFGTKAFLDLIRDGGPWDMLCHHAAEATNYRSPDFDVHAATLANTLNLRAVLREFKTAGGKATVLTGSVFENDEGAGDGTMRAFSGYGLSKGLTWQVFRFYCEEAGMRLGKFVIPNPFGPFEEPRFTAYLMKTWKQGQVAAVKTPDYVRDNIHVDLLAGVYVRFAEKMSAPNETQGVLKVNPSCYVESQGAFAERVAREVQSRTGWACGLDLMKQQDFAEPLKRINTQPAAPMCSPWSEKSAWDAFAANYT